MNPEFIFADANLFLRYITNDLPEQADKFEKLLLRAGEGEFSFVTNSMVIAEIIWTLETQYQVKITDIRSMVLAILNTPGIEITDRDLIVTAVFWYAEKNVDFIDAFNAAWMIDNEISSICTLDRKHFSRFENLQIFSLENFP